MGPSSDDRDGRDGGRRDRLREYALTLTGHAGANPRRSPSPTLACCRSSTTSACVPAAACLNVFVLLKVAALARADRHRFWGPAAPDWLSASRQPAATTTITTFAAALIPILFTYGGWQCANYLAEEMKEPERDLPRSFSPAPWSSSPSTSW